MIEIQCTSCHTRYRIDERVLPADSPTFKCSRCGHVFTADPGTIKKAAPEGASKPPTPRGPGTRTELKREPPPSPATPKIVGEAAKPAPSKELAPAPEPPVSSEPKAEAKPAPIKPYIRNQRPTMFDRSPLPSAKPVPEPVDSTAVARMKASFEQPKSEAPKPSAPSAPLRTAQPPAAQSSKASQTTQVPEVSKDSRTDNDGDDGDNLEFDFNDDDANPELGNESSDDDASDSPQRWSVGDEEPDTTLAELQSAFGRGEPDPGFSRGEPAPIGRGTIPQYAGALPPHRSPLPDERPFIERAELHSARSFIGLFFAVALVFVVVTLVIYGIPAASADLLSKMPVIGSEFQQPAPLENHLNVSEIQSSYQGIKGGHYALVLTGTVTNNSDVALHTIQIGVHLLDADQRELASSAVFCGTTLSPRMIGEMTPHELEFLQKLDPPKNFALAPAHAAPFLMVFIDPPRAVRHFAVAISRAQPPELAQAADANAHP
jgi:predicted Zn finger-like uncharacterized protein